MPWVCSRTGNDITLDPWLPEKCKQNLPIHLGVLVLASKCKLRTCPFFPPYIESEPSCHRMPAGWQKMSKGLEDPSFGEQVKDGRVRWYEWYANSFSFWFWMLTWFHTSQIQTPHHKIVMQLELYIMFTDVYGYHWCNILASMCWPICKLHVCVWLPWSWRVGGVTSFIVCWKSVLLEQLIWYYDRSRSLRLKDIKIMHYILFAPQLISLWTAGLFIPGSIALSVASFLHWEHCPWWGLPLWFNGMLKLFMLVYAWLNFAELKIIELVSWHELMYHHMCLHDICFHGFIIY